MTGNPWNWPTLIASERNRVSRLIQSDADLEFNFKVIPLKNSRLATSLDYFLERIAPCPWSSTTGSPARLHEPEKPRPAALYTPEERRRRDSTGWTLVQGILAPVQFLVFLVSLALVLNYLTSGRGYQIAAASVVVKTVILYAIMITGAIWENKVFGKYLFAPAFFWEDTVSMLVIALHTAYLLAMLANWSTPTDRMILALAAYVTYAINATQFVLKFRAARLQATDPHAYAKVSAR